MLALTLQSGCASDPRTRTVVETKVVEVPVEVYGDLPTELVDPLPMPPALEPGFTTGDLAERVLDLYDLVDQANRDRATLKRITQKAPIVEI